MSVPDFQSIMLPLLQFAGDGNEHTYREVINHLADKFNLSPEERAELLPSGTQTVFDNRVSWAKMHLQRAGLLFSPRRSMFSITGEGKKVLAQKPSFINMGFLRQYPEYLEFIKPAAKKSGIETKDKTGNPLNDNTPQESLEYSYQAIKDSLAREIIDKVKSNSPDFFERLVVELLVKMGYGGSIKDAGETTRRVKDEGIDGIIKEDKLGLDKIYIQAKKWEGSVGSPDVQQFAGALEGQKASKGIFITTSTFSATAVDYIKKIDKKIVLIDGKQLADYMIEYNVGVAVKKTFDIKELDSDYFEGS